VSANPAGKECNDVVRLLLAAIGAAIVIGGASIAAQHPAMPAGMTHEEHLAQMKKDAELKARGARAMGFDQDAVTHHFRLTREGGAIEVSVKDAADAAGRSQVRAHLKEITEQFAAGDFEKPFMTHAEIPPGAEAMQRLRTAIAYAYEDAADGGRLRITTRDPDALAAVHEFLRYQIREHATGDPLTVLD
jgi:hypothetical protein